MNFKDAKNYTQKLLETQWYMWVHEGTPLGTNQLTRQRYALLGLGKHCPMCLNLNGTYFTWDNGPEEPLHYNCHCYYLEVDEVEVTSFCDLAKWTKYVFNSSHNNGKKGLFESLGYSIIDSEYLKEEFERQAKLKYQTGDYTLGVLNEYGQRITIVMELKNRITGEIVTFKTGWMVYPNGKIVLTTTFCGWTNKKDSKK